METNVINILYVITTMQAIVDTKYYKSTRIISPGVVGTVGDVLGSVRLRQSTPGMASRYDKAFYGKNEIRVGSNVQDGYSYSYSSGGGPSRTLDSNLERTSFKTTHGWIHQDLRAPDKLLGEQMGSLGRFDWYNRVANIYEAKRTGDMFLPLPGEFSPTSMTRGSQIPRIVAQDVPSAQQLESSSSSKIQNKPKQIIGYKCTDEEGNVTFKRRPATGRPSPATSPSSTEPPPLQTPTPTTTTTVSDPFGSYGPFF